MLHCKSLQRDIIFACITNSTNNDQPKRWINFRTSEMDYTGFSLQMIRYLGEAKNEESVLNKCAFVSFSYDPEEP